jgi:hypothetical protein
VTPGAGPKSPLGRPGPFLLSALLLVLWTPLVMAGDEPFTFPSNLGLTGLLETPTARVMKENRYRLGASEVHPYRTYYGTVGIFDRMEVNGRVTEVIGIPGFTVGSPYGNYKDKAVDIKLQIFPEGKYTPALAVAILDPHGTRLYASQVLVASKQIHPFDFSIGLGNGRLGVNPLPSQGEGFGIELFSKPKQWWRDAQLFGGIQFAPSERFALVAEYSPIRYDRQTSDPAQSKYFTSPVPSRFNFGIRWKPTRWSEIDASWQRGDQVGISASVAFDIGRPLIPIYDAPYREPASQRLNPVPRRIADALLESGFSDIGLKADGATLWVEVQNDKYFFNARAIEVVLDILAERMPDSVDYVRIVIKENGIPLAEFATAAHGITALNAGEIQRSRFFGASAFHTSDRGTHVKDTVGRRRFAYGFKPSLETFLNDPSGYFKYRLGLSGWLTAQTWKGGSAILGLEGYPINTVSTSNTPLSIPVRSDIADYKKEDIAVGRLMAEQILKTRDPIFGRLSAGLLEVQFAGVDAEVAMPLFRGRILAGIGGSIVRKRDPDDPFKLKGGDRFHTSLLNTRLNLPEINVFVDVKAGRFLAGDKGAKVTLSKVVHGVVLSAWYSFTDTSIFNDTINRGYHDKGISVDIPIRLFTGHDSKTSYRYALSPWTRDVAQDVDHYRTLFDLIGRNTSIHFARDKESLFPGK